MWCRGVNVKAIDEAGGGVVIPSLSGDTSVC